MRKFRLLYDTGFLEETVDSFSHERYPHLLLFIHFVLHVLFFWNRADRQLAEDDTVMRHIIAFCWFKGFSRARLPLILPAVQYKLNFIGFLDAMGYDIVNFRTIQSRMIRIFTYFTIILKQCSVHLTTKNFIFFDQELLLELFLFLKNFFKMIVFKHNKLDDTFGFETVSDMFLCEELETIYILQIFSKSEFSGLGLPWDILLYFTRNEVH